MYNIYTHFIRTFKTILTIVNIIYLQLRVCTVYVCFEIRVNILIIIFYNSSDSCARVLTYHGFYNNVRVYSYIHFFVFLILFDFRKSIMINIILLQDFIVLCLEPDIRENSTFKITI